MSKYKMDSVLQKGGVVCKLLNGSKVSRERVCLKGVIARDKVPQRVVWMERTQHQMQSIERLKGAQQSLFPEKKRVFNRLADFLPCQFPSSEARPKGGIEIWVSHRPYPQARSGIGMDRKKDLDKIPKRDRIGGRDEERTDSHNRVIPGAGYSHAQNG